MADYPDGEHEHEHDHDHAAEDEVITLLDEDGKEHQFALLDVIEVEENEYAILIPAGEGDSDEETDEAVILRMEEDAEGNEVLVDIDDEAEFERVATAWEELLDDEDTADEEEDEE